VGVAEGISVGAVEVGGAGTGVWIWLSVTYAAYPVWITLAALALLAIAGLGITQALAWAFHKPGPTETQINAQHEIVNNPLPDKPQNFSDALGDDVNRQNQIPPVGSTSDKSNQKLCDLKATLACQDKCSALWDGKNAFKEFHCDALCKSANNCCLSDVRFNGGECY
jgi:hypothetical protein